MSAPLTCHDDSVSAEWVDYNGHMNAGAYGVVFSEAVDSLMDWLGIDAAFRAEQGYTLFTLETHIRYLREAHEGDRLAVDILLLDDDAKRLHIFEVMRQADSDVPLATCEAMLMGMDQAEGRPAPFPAAVAERIGMLRERHGTNGDWPEGAARRIGIRRG